MSAHPYKAAMQEQLALAADEIIRLRWLRQPLWWRLLVWWRWWRA